MMKRFISAAAVLAALLLAGCFETKLSLGPRESAKVDPKFVGNWHYAPKDGDDAKPADLLVLNFNGREYYTEWTQDKDTLRMNGYFADVKGVSFAHLTGLTEDGDLEEKHLIVRV